MGYSQISDLQNSYRTTLLLDLCTDGNSQRPLSLTSDATVTGVVQAALDQAAGMINSAILFAQRYQPSDLEALTGVDQAYLFALNNALAYWLLLKRVGRGDPPPAETLAALQDLEKIKQGERLFNVPENTATQQETITFPSFSALSTVGRLRDRCWKAFPLRQNQNPSNP